MLPSLFLSHGAPTLALSQAPAAGFLRGLPGLLPEPPRAILVASAHWERFSPHLSAAPHNDTIHDFGGFPPELYAMRYDAPGDPALAETAASLLRGAGFETTLDPRRGLDHGAWVPLSMAWPDADIPVIQLSIQTRLGPAHHLALGRALQSLRAQGVLVIGSGSWTHDLSSFRGQAEDAAEPEWVVAFADWADAAILQGRTADLLNYRALAPQAARNHPSEEHFLPLFVALGAGGDNPKIERLHRSTTFGILHMDAYAFG
jgi:4,5-DOPA dioxygenase extradiol